MSLGAHQQRGQDGVVADMGADIDEAVARPQLLDEGAGQPLLEESVLIKFYPDEVRQMHLHVAAKDVLAVTGQVRPAASSSRGRTSRSGRWRSLAARGRNSVRLAGSSVPAGHHAELPSCQSFLVFTLGQLPQRLSARI